MRTTACSVAGTTASVSSTQRATTDTSDEMDSEREEGLTPPLEQETQNYGCAGGMLHYRGTKQNREVWALEVHLMVSEAEYHANFGV